ncbi:hypothetical protein M5D96_011681, partial [Drosophila gunungcola]
NSNKKRARKATWQPTQYTLYPSNTLEYKKRRSVGQMMMAENGVKSPTQIS